MAETTYRTLTPNSHHTRMMYDMINEKDYFTDLVIDQSEGLLWNVAVAGLSHALNEEGLPFYHFYHGRDTENGLAFLAEARRVVFMVRETLRLN